SGRLVRARSPPCASSRNSCGPRCWTRSARPLARDAPGRIRPAPPDRDRLDQRRPPRAPAGRLETALYRITQGALTNAARHARAERVRVALTAIGGELRLEIEDDGVGLAVRNGGKPPTGTGLVGIRERLRAFGGQLVLHGERGCGWRCACRCRARAERANRRASKRPRRTCPTGPPAPHGGTSGHSA